MNLKLILIGVVLLCATLEAKKRGDSKKNALKLKNGSKNGKISGLWVVGSGLPVAPRLKQIAVHLTF